MKKLNTQALRSMPTPTYGNVFRYNIQDGIRAIIQLIASMDDIAMRDMCLSVAYELQQRTSVEACFSFIDTNDLVTVIVVADTDEAQDRLLQIQHGDLTGQTAKVVQFPKFGKPAPTVANVAKLQERLLAGEHALMAIQSLAALLEDPDALQAAVDRIATCVRSDRQQLDLISASARADLAPLNT